MTCGFVVARGGVEKTATCFAVALGAEAIHLVTENKKDFPVASRPLGTGTISVGDAVEPENAHG